MIFITRRNRMKQCSRKSIIIAKNPRRRQSQRGNRRRGKLMIQNGSLSVPIFLTGWHRHHVCLKKEIYRQRKYHRKGVQDYRIIIQNQIFPASPQSEFGWH